MADCEDIIGRVAENKYRIWIRRADTHKKIVDENIWVGNYPARAQYCKRSSGETSGECWAFVEFTWEELLKAIGEDSHTVDVLVTGNFEQTYDGGGGGVVNTTVTGSFEQAYDGGGGGVETTTVTGDFEQNS